MTATAHRPVTSSTLTWSCAQCGREFRAAALLHVEMPGCCSYACALRAEEGDDYE